MEKGRGIEYTQCLGDEPDPKSRSAGTLGFVEVTVRRTDGAGEVLRVDKPSGSPEKPMTDADLDRKFRDCARFAGLSEGQAEQALASWRGLADAPSVARSEEHTLNSSH